MTDKKNKKSSSVTFLLTFSKISRAFSVISILLMLLFIGAFVVQYIEDAPKYRLVRSMLDIDKKITMTVKANIPTKIGGKDMSRLIMIVGMFILSGSFTRMAERLKDKSEYFKFKSNLDIWKREMNLSDNAIVLTPLNQKLEQLKNAKKKDREQLLKEFIETKKKLDEMGRDLAFLAIDVVDSTGMKEGEEKAIIEHDFKEYKRFVERAFASHGSLKAAWTPDGVMSCFNSVDAAVRAAREVITGLDDFNKNVKGMRSDFRVRCGVNSGFVYFDESIPLEEISDRVIDIAGHMQKNAAPNTVCIAKPTIEPLNERTGFEPSGRIVDGYEVYEWKKT
ncbi:MAG: adenylate/guanylate cyclase domain-containing protein [Ignavibacteriales bacterium]|nr:adenylate/guanylate cyclase domain-containing protein [Ignavibacteriales bacterium]